MAYTVCKGVNMKYDKELKEKMLEEYTNTNITRKEICTKYNVPFETFKGWLRYDHNCSYGKRVIKKRSASTSAVFNSSNYKDMSREELQLALIQKDIEIAKLKKKYPWLADMDDMESDGQNK